MYHNLISISTSMSVALEIRSLQYAIQSWTILQFLLIHTLLCIALLNSRYIPLYLLSSPQYSAWQFTVPSVLFPFFCLYYKSKEAGKCIFLLCNHQFFFLVMSLISSLSIPRLILDVFLNSFCFALQVLKSFFLSVVSPTGSAIINSA